MEISDRVILAGLIYFMKLKGGSDSAFTPDLDPNAKTQTAEDTSGGESKDPDKDKDKACIPIIAMTANAFEEDKRKAIEAGMNDHIAKPIQVDKLLLTLKTILTENIIL